MIEASTKLGAGYSHLECSYEGHRAGAGWRKQPSGAVLIMEGRSRECEGRANKFDALVNRRQMSR